MLIVKGKINKILDKKNLTIYQLNKLMDFSEGALRQMINNKSPFSKNAIEKLLPIFEISREEFESWILADKYPKEVLKLAIKAKKEFPYKRKSILTARIDKILEQKEISRTTLAKQINYSQSGLNTIIIGKRSMSKSVLEKLSEALEISQNEISSWIIADKYSLSVLEQACTCLQETE